MNRILTMLAMGYFMIIVFSVANVPDPNEKYDAITCATYKNTLEYALSNEPQLTNELQVKRWELFTDRSHNHTMSLDEALSLRKSVRTYENTAIEIPLLTKLLSLCEKSSEDTFQIIAIARQKGNIPDAILIWDREKKILSEQNLPQDTIQSLRKRSYSSFAQKAPVLLILRGKSTATTWARCGQFAQRLSLLGLSYGIGSCIIGGIIDAPIDTFGSTIGESTMFAIAMGSNTVTDL